MVFHPLDLAREVCDARGYERAVLAALGRSVGFDAAFFATAGDAPTAVAVDPEQLGQAIASRAYDDELAPLKRAAGRARVVVDTALLGEAEVRRRRYFRAFAAPVGGRHTLLAPLSLRGRPLGLVMLGRSGRSFSSAQIDVVASALPDIAMGRASFGVGFVGSALPAAPEVSGVQRALHWARGERVLAQVERDAHTLIVRDRGGHREMVAQGAEGESIWSRSRLDDPRRSGWFYVDLLHLAAARARRRRRVLFIGAGGAVSVRQFAETYPGVEIDLVDVDPCGVELARAWFGLGGIPGVTTHAADGFSFVERAPDRKWDVVIVDAFDAKEAPRSVMSRDFFRHARRVLCSGGAMAFNAIGALASDGPVRRVERLARLAFEDVRLVPVLDPGEAFSPVAVRNVVVLGSA